MDYIPEANSDYASLEYWNKRYETEETYEWFKGYQDFRHILLNYLKPEQRILVLGCGNSRLSEDLCRDGFHNIVNVDYSEVVIDRMKSHCQVCSSMSWLVMDMRDLRFPDKSFDVILEKGTLDAILATEKDPWNPHEDCRISRILKNDGRFISISFSQPHFRRRLYEHDHYGWSFSCKTFGQTFCYFVYVMSKGETRQRHSGETANSVHESGKPAARSEEVVPSSVTEDDEDSSEFSLGTFFN